jgi:hypothetical protein
MMGHTHGYIIYETSAQVLCGLWWPGPAVLQHQIEMTLKVAFVK